MYLLDITAMRKESGPSRAVCVKAMTGRSGLQALLQESLEVSQGALENDPVESNAFADGN